MTHLVVLRCRNLDISVNRDNIWPRVLLKFHGFNRTGLGAAEARENASKKGSRACYSKWCEGMAVDTCRGRSAAAGWRGRRIGRGRSRRRICIDWRGEDRHRVLRTKAQTLENEPIK